MSGAATALREAAEHIAEDAPAVEQPAPNVIVALTRVIRDLPGIGRDQTASAQQGGYAYRGIEQITVETQRLFARHCIVFTPHTISYEVRDLVINGKPWTDVYEMVEYTVYGPGGVSDCIKVGPILAIGRDNSDKGGNKCLTQAYKYALIQALNISDAKDDADGTTHVADPRSVVVDPDKQARSEVSARIRGLNPRGREAIRAFCDEHSIDRVAAHWTDEQLEQVIEAIDFLELAPADSSPEGDQT